ncbi:putative RNA-directed DNA polymerase from transposon X-element [Trichonephila clavipes]|nr:putative RNA-directed DNA polymerase from transposon X-element [Trichonephila clavipes]
MVQNRAVDNAILNVTEAIQNAANAAIPKILNSTRKPWKPWWNSSYQQSKKEQRRAWVVGKVKAANGLYREFTIPIFETSTALYSSSFDVTNLIGQTYDTSPGPDGIFYELLRHLNEDSLVSLLYLFNPIWRELVYPTQRQEAIVIPILKPGKDPRTLSAIYRLHSRAAFSGFRKGRSTLDNIIMLESKSKNAFVRRNHLVSIFFDIEKAYDRTWRYDGSKRAGYVGCGVVIEDNMLGYRLDPSCSVFTAEAGAFYRALQLIDSNMPRKYCIYTNSMSVLDALENCNNWCHPVVCIELDITSRLYSKGFDVLFCWLPSHVGIIGTERTARQGHRRPICR